MHYLNLDGSYGSAGQKKGRFTDIYCRLLLVTVLLLELKALSKGGTKLTAQIGVGSAQTERPADAASALLIGDEEI